MLNTWHTIKGYVAGAVALVACPCHLPLTLPLLIGLTAGTAFSAWLENNFIVVAAILTVFFIGGLVMSMKWMRSGDQVRALSPQVHTGPFTVTLITSSICDSCENAKTVWREVRRKYKFEFEEVDITSSRGRELAARYNIFTTPTTLINGRVAFRGAPGSDQAAAAVRI